MNLSITRTASGTHEACRGAREGKWTEISWDQALDEIAAKLNGIRRNHGPESITLGFGTYPKGGVIPTFVFCQAIGSPQHMTIDGPYCFTPTSSPTS